MNIAKTWIALGLFLGMIAAVPQTACAAEFYVAPNGKDTNPGTKAKPFATLDAARKQVRKFKASHADENITVWLRGGVYRLSKTVVFTLADSGNEKQTITYAAWPGEKPILSAGMLVTKWKRLAKAECPKDLPEVARGKVWVADVSFLRDVKREQPVSPTVAPQMDRMDRILTLYCNGQPLPRASSKPFFLLRKRSRGSKKKTQSKKDPFQLSDPRVFKCPKGLLGNWEDISEAELLAVPNRAWVSSILPIERVDAKRGLGRVQVEPTYPLDITRIHVQTNNASIENSIALLDKPGEWVHDSRSQKLYLWPVDCPDNANQPPKNITAPVLTELVRVEGKIDYAGPTDVPVRHLVFRGLTFTQGDRFRWHGGTGWGVQHDWDRFDTPNAMLRFRGAEHCAIEHCTLTTAGSGGIRLDLYCQKNRINGCNLHDLGGTGILFCGYGMGTKDVNRDNQVENNVIHDVAQSYWGSPGIFAWQSGHNRIANNEVYNLPYCGICVTGRISFSKSKTAQCSQSIRWNELEAVNYHHQPARIHVAWKSREKYLHARENLVLRNDIHHVMRRCGDGNAIYVSGAGGKNKLLENYCHDCPSKLMNCAIRCDDDQHETLIHRNIICRTSGDGDGFLMKGKNTFTENLIVDLRPNSGRHRGYIRFYAGDVRDGIIARNVFYSCRLNQSVNLDAPKHSRRKGRRQLLSPKLRDTKADYNLYFCTKDPKWGVKHLKEQRPFGIEKHSISADPLFVDIDHGNFRFRPGSPALKLGIAQPVSLEKIGPQKPYCQKLKNKER